MMGGIMCAVNVEITMCDIKTCQHSFMTDEQHKAYRSAILKEFNRKQSLPQKNKP
jgi:hypothetical protein